MFSKRRIQFRILEYLRLKGGSATDRDLYEMLRKEFDISYSQLLNMLMSMEIEGFISIRASREVKLIVLKKYRSTV